MRRLPEKRERIVEDKTLTPSLEKERSRKKKRYERKNNDYKMSRLNCLD